MTFYYVPIEVLKARYTGQLGNEWIPQAFAEVTSRLGLLTPFEAIHPLEVSQEIKTGSVLDGVNRGLVSLAQMSALLQRIDSITSDDVIYLQDMWTPGFEALLYAFHLRNIKPRIYAMCHAQSVDEFDFTYPMRSWMRPIEIGWSRALSGLFVGSTIHRDQLKAAGIECPIHVVGLPIHAGLVVARMGVQDQMKQVIFSSRLNAEKNPYFMLNVAEVFLRKHPDWRWVVTTSAATFTSEVPGLLGAMKRLTGVLPGQFLTRAGLPKNEYYKTLQASNIQFNSSLQDYISWTLLEATLAGCDLCYPNFRSFPECVDKSRLYTPFDVGSAVKTLERCIRKPRQWPRAVLACNDGLRIELAIMLTNWRGPEVNVWHQSPNYFIGAGLL